MKSLGLALAALCIAPLAIGGSGTATPEWEPLFPTPEGPLVITGIDRPMTVMEVVRAYSDLTGQNFIIGQDARGYLEGIESGVLRDAEVPAEEVQTFFENVLQQNYFVLTILHPANPRLLTLHSLQTGARNSIRSSATFVDSKHADKLASHPAVMFTTTVQLPNTDVRQLSNSMRTMITDANTQQMLPAGNTNSMVLTGFGRDLSNLIETLRTVDEASAIGATAPPAKAPGGGVK